MIEWKCMLSGKMILQGFGRWSSKLTWGSCFLTVILILSRCFFSCVSFHTIFLLFLVCHNPLILCRESYVPKILKSLKDLYIHLIYNRGINVKCLWYDSLSKLQLYTALRFKGSHNAFHEIPEYSYVKVLFKNWRFKGQGWKGMRTWWNFALWQFCSEGLNDASTIKCDTNALRVDFRIFIVEDQAVHF